MAGEARARADLSKRGDGEFGDLGGVVFDLARVGEELGQFAVGGVDDPRLAVKRDRADPRGAGVKG
jgi:hypothetical protein